MVFVDFGPFLELLKNHQKCEKSIDYSSWFLSIFGPSQKCLLKRVVVSPFYAVISKVYHLITSNQCLIFWWQFFFLINLLCSYIEFFALLFRFSANHVKIWKNNSKILFLLIIFLHIPTVILRESSEWNKKVPHVHRDDSWTTPALFAR